MIKKLVIGTLAVVGVFEAGKYAKARWGSQSMIMDHYYSVLLSLSSAPPSTSLPVGQVQAVLDAQAPGSFVVLSASAQIAPNAVTFTVKYQGATGPVHNGVLTTGWGTGYSGVAVAAVTDLGTTAPTTSSGT